MEKFSTPLREGGHSRDTSATKSLNIIGAGKLGRTLARLWQERGVFDVRAVCNRSLHSGKAAVDFIGAGKACASIDAMPTADCWLIASADGQIGELATALAAHLETLSAGSNAPVVFHCSGALSSEILRVCHPANVASAHPVHSFADPVRSLETLAGSTVAIEGNDAAVTVLRAAFSALDCQTVTISSEQKTLYHAGSVFACNYLTALMDLSLQCFAGAGMQEEEALALLRPIVMQTARNNMDLGPGASLTGPIARGDATTVEKQLAVLTETSPLLAENYRQLGLACVELARRGPLADDAAEKLEAILNGNPQ